MEEEGAIESSIPDSSECDVSIPRGGPIYIPNMLSPSTTLNHFHSSLLYLLQDLDQELLNHHHHDDLSVHDLKVFTDHDLMDMTLKQLFHDRENNENHPPLLDQSNDKNSRRKRKRKGSNNAILQSGCLEKVEQIVRIKHKQEEDKEAVRLNSFNPSCKITESAQSSTRVERMRSLRSTSSIRKQVNTVNLQEQIPVLHPEVVLSVEVYHNVRKRVKTQELLVLGGQTLSALRDKIYCSMDHVMQKAEQNDPSGYFLIEDVFYNDLRDPSAIDYSRPILDWLQNSKDEAQKKWEYIMNGEVQQKQKSIMGEVSAPDLPHFTSGEMHKIHFCDLRIRLGAGYLYCHQEVIAHKTRCGK
ncbi:PREDICTED: snRNA-activating protein complex subunit isoform X3 [Lupinus angustifolius]|uniref:snRNA-activating protein complex subunit isoform X3 n=1 Tax=Lupinus angustifolius TaxID=3871 RepID=UPI00092EB8E8|nr:PREDICTED: snRNA-activating protein complex subunit isoform X3 [Lupinus angustifolius]